MNVAGMPMVSLNVTYWFTKILLLQTIDIICQDCNFLPLLVSELKELLLIYKQTFILPTTVSINLHETPTAATLTERKSGNI